MDDRRALMAAIIANPDEDTPRLVFADWLDEHGDEHDQARAEFIRLQIEQHRLPPRAEAERARIERAAGALERKHRKSWLAPLHALDPTTPPAYAFFVRGLLANLPVPTGDFLRPAYQRALPDALAVVGVEELLLQTAITKVEALTGAPAMRWVCSLTTDTPDDATLRVLARSPDCAHLSALYLFSPKVTDAGLRSFAKTTAVTRLRHFGVTGAPHRLRYTAKGVLAVLNSSRLPLLNSLTVYDWAEDSFEYAAVFRDPGAARLMRLELAGPVPLSELLTHDHFRQLRDLRLEQTTVTDADVTALLTSSTLSGLTHLRLSHVNPGRPRLSKESEARLVARFGSKVIEYSPLALRRPRAK